MILITNNDSSYRRKLVDDLRITSKVNAQEKLFNIKEKFKEEVLNHARSGSNSMIYTIVQKPDETFMNENLINMFKEFILIECGLHLEYEYVEEDVDGTIIRFHRFDVFW